MSYETTVKNVYKNSTLASVLRLVSLTATLLCGAVFIAVLVIAALESIGLAVSVAVSFGVPFLAVSAVRRLINLPRPYEVFDFGDAAPKKKSGRSFPSRHAFSAFAIAAAATAVSLPLAITAFVLGAALSVSRVLLGIHFPKDVAVGALIGILGILIGFWIFAVI